VKNRNSNINNQINKIKEECERLFITLTEWLNNIQVQNLFVLTQIYLLT
jgi:hypothetical protein